MVEANGWGDSVEIHPKHSGGLAVARELTERASLVVCEVFGQQLLEEHAVSDYTAYMYFGI